MGYRVATRHVFGRGAYQIVQPAVIVPPSPPTPAMVGTPGTVVYSADNTVDPTTIAPDTGSGYAIGALLLCFTINWGTTGACATPAGWTLLGDGAGTTAFHMVLFGKIAASTTEAAPSLVWTSLTTGTSGWSSGAQCAAFSGAQCAVDVAGPTGTSSTSTTISNGGNQFTTLLNNDLMIKMSTRGKPNGDTWSASGYTNVSGGAGAGATMHTTNSNDFAAQWAWKVKATAGLEAVANFSISGGVTTGTSSGITVALKSA